MMTRINYNNDLQALYDAVKQMGLTIETSIDQTWKALQKLDMKTAQAIIDGDETIDQMERNIEKACLELVLTQTPVAGDWRRIASIMRMISDLERIADHCSDISEYIIQLAAKPAVELPAPMEKMFCLMKTMVKDTVNAFVELSEEKARAVIGQDDLQDDYFLQVGEELCTRMQQHPEEVRQRVDQLMIAKYLERMSDHSTNLAEWVVYIVSGQLVDN
ncbi:MULTISPECIES: phosphate signaling complex protein PhoU [Eubacteriales]|uniref:phosphate signaling complex protein PhoU n=1 Tax=Eubacteriales TaxID=186802 RepID=UPI000B3AA838|nr:MULTISPECIES: phosphate signaling complex protein PhoU [Eubacteriales]OUP24693.1 phosphate transport system regulatory protein PhoU [Gemmiger sp. An194]